MSASQSDLSNPHYGYDIVVATTQESINATMQEYLYNGSFPVVKMYWNQDSDGNPVPVSYDELIKQTNGTDPLEVQSWKAGEPETQEIKNINNSNFYFAFEAGIGVPDDLGPQYMPDIITLQENSQSVIFNLLCAEFTIVTCTFGRRGLTSVLNISQPDDSPWLFTSIVALKNIINNKNLPPNVQEQLDNFGPDAFSVQQLLFDLDNAAIESTPTIKGVKPGTPAYTALEQVFVGAYFSEMKSKAQPVLGYAIVKNKPSDDRSTFHITNLELEVSPYLDPDTILTDNNSPISNTSDNNNNLNTLNYLCEVNGRTLPPPVPFAWNWIEKPEKSSFNGVIAINRDTFADYFKDQLTEYVSKNCFLVFTRVWLTNGIKVNYSYKLTSGQSPKITRPKTGSKVLSYSYASEYFDQAGIRGDMGRLRIRATTDVSVEFKGNTIVISQHLVIYVKIQKLQTALSWNAVDKKFTDTYTLTIDQNGDLNSELSSKISNNSESAPKANWFIESFANINDYAQDLDDWTKNYSATHFKSLPINVAQKFVFPGGKTFAFKDVEFSDNQDMISHITYTQPE